METAKIKIPTTNEELKIFNKEIRQLEKGCLKELESTYRGWINKNFFIKWNKNKKREDCKFPICCEFCKHVGTAFWHCHNPNSFKQHINVSPSDVCSKWEPNIGLMILLWDRICSGRETGVGFHLEELKSTRGKNK